MQVASLIIQITLGIFVALLAICLAWFLIGFLWCRIHEIVYKAPVQPMEKIMLLGPVEWVVEGFDQWRRRK